MSFLPTANHDQFLLCMTAQCKTGQLITHRTTVGKGHLIHDVKGTSQASQKICFVYLPITKKLIFISSSINGLLEMKPESYWERASSINMDFFLNQKCLKMPTWGNRTWCVALKSIYPLIENCLGNELIWGLWNNFKYAQFKVRWRNMFQTIAEVVIFSHYDQNLIKMQKTIFISQINFEFFSVMKFIILQ